MKPEDLKPPFRWNERTVVLKDRVLYVPSHFDRYHEFQMPTWSDPSLFDNNHPIHMEYCSGNGAWIADKAQKNPAFNWVAVERKFDRVQKIWSKLKNFNLTNLLIICGEAYTVTSHYFPDETLAQVYINFPDPWPKNRHVKHRLMRDDFLQLLNQKMIKKGVFTLVTDDINYSEESIKILNRNANFQSFYPSPYYSHEFVTGNSTEYGTSYFDSLWRSKGKKIRYHQYVKD